MRRLFCRLNLPVFIFMLAQLLVPAAVAARDADEGAQPEVKTDEICEARRLRYGPLVHFDENQRRAICRIFNSLEARLKAIQALNDEILICLKRVVQVSDFEMRFDDDQTRVRFTVANQFNRPAPSIRPLFS